MEYYAFAFLSQLTLGEMLERLAALGYRQWHERFKDAWGEYLFGRLNPAPFNAVATLISEDGHFVLNVKLRREQPGGDAEYLAVRKALMNHVFPALQACLITPAEYME